MTVRIVGVRHHSPACARLAEAVIRELRPTTVLIEGPCDMNERLDELLLDHELPVALYSFLRTPDGTARASWYPLCSYSPEWVALRVGREVGADVRFMDLPAWHDSFTDVVNLSADRTDRYEEAVQQLCRRTGTNGHDALWDHLFEAQHDLVVLAAGLDEYFAQVRTLSPAPPRDLAREEHMRAYVSAAERRGGEVVVVCGGFHAPALAHPSAPRGASTDGEWTDWPPDPEPPGGFAESYLVPYTYRRLDSFTGYQSGMPSPAYYEALYRAGAGGAAEALLEAAVTRLREARQPVSTADFVAARTQAEALARLRAHTAPLRVDLLDGLTSSILKDAVEAPLPWERREPLQLRTHPFLVELVSAFSGDRVGRLDRRTPRPPLLHDVKAQLDAVGLHPTARPTSVLLDRSVGRDLATSTVLHRLRVLSIPGFTPSEAGLRLDERWEVLDAPDADAATIEASIHGPTLEEAAGGQLGAAMATAVGLGASNVAVAVLLDAVLCDLRSLAVSAVQSAAQLIEGETDLARLGRSLQQLAVMMASDPRHDELEPVEGDLRTQVSSLAHLAIARFLWLLEQVSGPSSAADFDMVAGLVALCGACRQFPIDIEVLTGTLGRCSVDRDAPPALRGGCLGALWSLDLLDEVDDGAALATAALHGLRPDEQPGDFLNGLFATARHLVSGDDSLLQAVNGLVESWSDDEFLVALPPMRAAFRWFPARERSAIADRVVSLLGLARGTRLTGQLGVDPSTVAAGAALDARVNSLIERYGLYQVVPGGQR